MVVLGLIVLFLPEVTDKNLAQNTDNNSNKPIRKSIPSHDITNFNVTVLTFLLFCTH